MSIPSVEINLALKKRGDRSFIKLFNILSRSLFVKGNGWFQMIISAICSRRFWAPCLMFLLLMIYRLKRSAQLKLRNNQRSRMQYVKSWYSSRQAVSYFISNISKYLKVIKSGENTAITIDATSEHLATKPTNLDQIDAGHRPSNDPHENWHADIEMPRYEWDQLLSWQVLRWILYRGVDLLAGSKGVMEDVGLAMDRLLSKNRWEVQDPEHVACLVGNTPLIAIHLRYLGRRRVIYAKCEYYNLTGPPPRAAAPHRPRTGTIIHYSRSILMSVPSSYPPSIPASCHWAKNTWLGFMPYYTWLGCALRHAGGMNPRDVPSAGSESAGGALSWPYTSTIHVG
jgi:hypothetical protein